MRDKEDLLGREGGFEEERHARVGLAEGDEQRAAARHGLDVLDERKLRAHLEREFFIENLLAQIRLIIFCFR